MKRWIPVALLFAVVAAFFVFDRQAQPHPIPDLGDQPVLVELFTSQGCSSCPPADELLQRIAHDRNLHGRVIPLAYHVDYWDHLGWRDPFSSREWSQRQGDYVHAMSLDSAYTPQVVINGTRQMVGSASGAIYRAIEEESKRMTEASVSIKRDGEDVVVSAGALGGGLDVMIAVYEDDVQTNVERGENRGRTFVNGSIVRKLLRVGTLDGKSAVNKRVRLALGPHMGAVAFLQNPKTGYVAASSVI